MKKWLSSIFIFFFLSLFSFGQNTIGTLSITDEALDGYTFFSPFSGTKAYMVDNCGRLVNEWDRGTFPGLAAYFLDNGLMLRTYKIDPIGPFTSASNAGGLELVDWDNNTIWSYEFNTENTLSHHDAVYLPNGNILVLLWDLVFRDELVELGRDPSQIAPQNFMWSERIAEIQPVGNNDIEIIWEWRIKDHYIQDFDDTKAGFGVVADHPELFDINLPDLNSGNSNSTRDWNHFNAIDYDEERDHILISTRNSDELWILDHSTTTEEASGHEGGNAGRGGDIIYRWGNASAYQRGAIQDQKLFGQHGINFIDDGLNDEGKILIFNNGNGRPGTDISSVEILSPSMDGNFSYEFPATEAFGPQTSEYSYGLDDQQREYSPFLSNAQRLSNGNTLVNYGSLGYIREITENEEISWEYRIPLSGDTPGNQGGFINQNSSFRAYKFARDFEGFDNISIELGDPIESNPNIDDCLLTSTEELLDSKNHVSILYSASDKVVSIDTKISSYEIVISNLLGHRIKSIPNISGYQRLNMELFENSFYIISIKQNNRIVVSKSIVLF